MRMFGVESLAVEHYGPEHQKRKAIEEMGELLTALAREQDARANTEQVITEIADVIIMMRQLSIIYGIADVNNEIECKERRLLKRMEKETKNLHKSFGK